MGPVAGNEIVNVQLLLGPVTTVLGVVLVVSVLANLRAMPTLRAHRVSHRTVTVLVPARDEADGIVECVMALLAQDHEAVEIIVLDDESTDSTADLVRAIDDPRVRVVAGAPLPDGWTGKNWACHQLSQIASGEVLCFVDADTVLAPTAVRAALEVIEGGDLVTALPAAEYRTAAQTLLLPMVNHALIAMFPVWLMHSRRFPRVVLGLGPFIMVTREAYVAAGGHAASAGKIADDVELCRAVKATGGTVRLANGVDVVRTRWYRTVHEIWRGFAKNAFGALDGNLAIAATTVLILVPLMSAPFIRLTHGLLVGSVSTEELLQVLLFLTARAMTSAAGRDPLVAVPLHVVTVLFWGATLAWSVMLTLGDRTVDWRDRAVAVRSRGG